jgi:GDPmannose 4,6-dehydratase
MKWISLFFILIFGSASCVADAKKALIFGVTGQDGSYLAEFLLEKGYEVHGFQRRSSNIDRIKSLVSSSHPNSNQFFLHYGDLTDGWSIFAVIDKVRPDEIYNLAAQSHVQMSFEMSEYTTEVNAIGTLRILDAIQRLGLTHHVRLYQACTSELYGLVQEIPQVENTPFYPRSPYAISKLFSYWIVTNYRESYNLFAVNGILFNHESPRRGDDFVTRKITKSVAMVANGLPQICKLGNLDAKRDWGYAKDYVEAMWLMLQQETPEDFVIASGEVHSVREFAELAFREIGIDIEWRGEGIYEEGIDRKTGRLLIQVDPVYFRPSEVDFLLGSSAKAEARIHWKPKTSFVDLVKIMVQADCIEYKRKK